MESIKDIIFELQEVNAKISVIGDSLKIDAAKGAIDDRLRSLIKLHKQALVDYINQTRMQFRQIQPVVEQETYPLSSSQRRLWLLSQFEEGNIAYNIQGAYELEGSLDAWALGDCFEQMIGRHEILRTVFRADEQGEVRQYVQSVQDSGFRMLYLDLFEHPDAAGRVQVLLEEEAMRPFDLSKGPLWRAVLYRTDANRWVLGTVMHHIISDEWSMGIIIRELLQLYNARVHNEAYPLAPLRIQYKDYASWQQEQLQEGVLTGARSYWLGQLAGELPVLELPTDRARPVVKTYKGGLVQRRLSKELVSGLRSVSLQQGGTMYMGLLAGVVALLYRYTGQEDIILGSPVAGREHSDLDGQLGFYINALALRMRFSGTASCTSLLEQVKEVTVGAYEHQAYPFDALVGELSLMRDRSRSPLFDVLVDYHEGGGAGLLPGEELSGLSVRGYNLGNHAVSKYDLTFMFVAAGEEIAVLLEYNSDLYHRSTIERMSDHLEGLLSAIVAAPQTSLAELDYIRAAERHTLVETFNATGPWGDYESVLSLFDAQAARVPEQLAVVYGNRSLTYRTLQERSVALGNYLRHHSGVRPGELVGILLDRSENMVVAILGVLRAGGAYVPIDPSYPAARKEYILQDTGIRTLLTQTEYLFDLDSYGGNMIALDVQLETMDSAKTLSDLRLVAGPADDELRAILPAAQDAAYVIYTSGSTGMPKGCVVTQGNLCGYVRWANGYYFDGAVPHFGLYTSLSFDLTVTSIFCCLTLGGRLTVYGQQEEMPAILTDMFGDGSGIDHIKLTPSHINLLKGLGLRSTSMKRAIVGGEQVTAEQVRILKELNAAITIYNEYGPTETTVGCVVGTLEPGEPILIGQPISGVRIYILDKNGALCPIGIPGEIGIAGGGVSLGYWNKEALTAEKFVANSFVAGERMYRSGDIGRWLANGTIEYLGRRDEQVKIRGYRIELGEIERALEAHPAIGQAVVTVYVNRQGEKELAAYVVSAGELTVGDIRAYLGLLLPSYGVPAHFVQLDAIPLTANGKVDRRGLPAPEGISLAIGETYVAARSVLEAQLVAIWERVLERDRIGIQDNFFELGGDSIKVLRIMAEIKRELGLDIPIAVLYEHTTIERVAGAITGNEAMLLAGGQALQEQGTAIEGEMAALKARVLQAATQQAGDEQHVAALENIADIYPTSAIESGMLFASLLEEDRSVYHDQFVYRQRFVEFDRSRFERAMSLLVDKHAILRTSFHLTEYEQEVKFVHKHIAVMIDYRDLSDKGPAEQKEAIEAYMREELRRPFVITEAPLWRMSVFYGGGEDYQFLWQFHHAIMDGWSTALFITELNNLYLKLEEDTGYIPTPLRSGHKEFAVRHLLEQRDAAVKQFWQQELLEAERLDLFTEEEDFIVFDKEFGWGYAQKLEQAAVAMNTTVKGLSLSAYLQLLKALGYGREVLAGLVTNTRPGLEDGDNVLGCFLNTIPLRMEINSEASVEDFVQRVKDKLTTLKEKERLSLPEIAIAAGEQPGGNPFFDTMFNYVDFYAYQAVELDKPSTEGSGATSSPQRTGGRERTNTFFDFTVGGVTGGKYSINLRLTRKLKCDYSLEQIGEWYTRILDELIAQPDRKLGDLDLLGAAERHRLLDVFNDTAAAYPADKTLVDLFETQVQTRPQSTALVFRSESFTYQELNEGANQLAHYLRGQHGVTAGDVVAVCLPRSEWQVQALLGILKAGGAYVPIDPAYPAERIAYMLSDSGSRLVIDEAALQKFLSQKDTFRKDSLARVSAPGDPAYVIYTSGSTGKPKGVRVGHDNVVNFFTGMTAVFGSEPGTMLALTNYTFDISILELIWTLTLGFKVVLQSDVTDIVTGDHSIYTQLTRHQVTHMQATPSMAMLLNTGFNDLPVINSLKKLLLGGEQLPLSLVQNLYRQFPEAEIYNMYGPTETTIWSSCYKVDQQAKKILIGKPIVNTQIYILNVERQVLPAGVTGEIYIGGDGVAQGYLNRPELTQDRFLENPFKAGERVYRTGDFGRWMDDGNIEYIGRKDDQVKVRGHRIELGEVGKALQQHEAIKEVVVVARKGMSNDMELLAYFTAIETINPADIRRYLLAALPIYMLPARFVQLEKLPLTANGKVDRKRLPDPGASSVSGVEYIAPRTPLEMKLAEIWQEVLGRERVGVKDNFFDLGGHSLRVMRLTAQVQKVLEVKVELREWFMTAVLEEQAVLIGGAARTTFTGITPVLKQESYPLSSSQRRLWVLSQFEGGNIAYNIPGVHELEGSLDVAALRDSFQQLARRHEILRTVFRYDDRGDVRQYVLEAEDSSLHLSYKDLCDQKGAEEWLRTLLETEHLTPFDLSAGPLWRVVLYRTGDNRWVLSYVLHHIISDQWSMGIMIRELLQLYNARVHGEAYPLSPLRIQYKDYASWQQEQLQDGVLAGARSYWLGKLSGELPVLELPTDRARPAVKTYKGGLVQRQLNAELTAALKVTSKGQGGTLYMGLLSAVLALLYRYTGQEDIILGSPVAGREHSDLDGQLGFYINALALRTRFSGTGSYTSLLEQVKQVTVEAYEHQAYPFDALVGELPLARDRSRSPLFDVLVDYHEEDGAGLQPGEGLLNLSAKDYDRGEHGVSKYDLTFMFVAAGEATTVLLEYNSDLYDRATIERMGDHLEGLLTAIVAAPQTSLAELDYIRAAERHTLVETFNATGSWGDYEPVISLFDAQAARVPEQLAVMFGNRSLTYRTLQERSVALGNYLRQHNGVQPGELVGILLDRSENMVVAILGILRAGGAYVPIDPSYPAARKEYIVQDTGITTLLTQTEYLFDLDYYGGNVIALDVQLEGMDSVETLSDLQLEAGPAGDKLRAITPAEQDAAYVIYTSGSTGMPKGCVVTQANLSGYVRWANGYYFEGATPNFALYTSLSFDLTVTSIFCALTLGGRLTVYGQQEDVPAILSDMFSSNSGIDHVKLTPSHINLLKGLGLPSTAMKRAIVGGEQVTAEQVRILKELNPAITIYNEYGPTETTVGCVVATLEPGEPILIGQPISGVRIYILDASGNLCPIGVAGEIGIAGGGVSQGYWNKEALTAERFVLSPFHPEERMYRSGDIGRWLADGTIEYLGRRDEQVKIRGYRIELGEIEKALEGYEGIDRAVVSVHITKAGDRELVAYLVGGEELPVSAMRAYLGSRLPSYEVPAHFVQLEAIPLTANGKVDRKALPAPEGIGLASGATYVAARGVLETQLVAIWERVLERERIGIQDNFFELGGDSIKVLRVMAEIKRELGLDIPIAVLYEHATIEAVAGAIAGNEAMLLAGGQVLHEQLTAVEEEMSALKARILESAKEKLRENGEVTTPIENISDIFPTSAIESGMLFASLLEGDRSVYHDQFVYRQRFVDFDRSRFERAMSLLVDKHAILRTSFHLTEYEQEVKFVHKRVPVTIDYRDLSGSTEAEKQAAISDYMSEELRRPFVITEAPLWRMTVFYGDGGDDYQFVWQFHHAILDGWSTSLFIPELNNLYLKLGEDNGYIPMPLRSGHKEFTVRHLLEQRDAAVKQFWQQELSGAERLDLFTEEETYAVHSKGFGQTYTQALERAAVAMNTTVKGLSLSAYLQLLKALGYGGEVLAGLVTNTRPGLEDGDKVLGCFLNTIPLRMEIAGEQRVEDFVQRVKDKLTALKDKERLSLPEIALAAGEQPGGNPFFDTMFNYVDFYAYQTAEADKPSTEDSEAAADPQQMDGRERTNTFFDFTVGGVTGGQYSISLRLTRVLKCGYTLEQLGELYIKILDGLIADSGLRLKDLDLLGAAERHRLLELFNDTAADYPADKTLVELFEEQVRSRPQATALVFRGESFTYQELNEGANQLAHYLRGQHGVTAEDVVGVCLPRSGWQVQALLGILKAGGAYVPIDPAYPAERIAYMLKDSGSKVVLNEEELQAFLSCRKDYSNDSPARLSTPTDLAYVIYTSGSTGSPKGCMLEHGGVVNRIDWMWKAYGFTKEDSILQKTTSTFDVSVWELFLPLCWGAKMVLCEQDDIRSPERILSLIEREQVTCCHFVPSMLQAFIHTVFDQPTISASLQSLRQVICSGEALSVETVRQWKQKVSIPIHNLYGPTEASVDVTAYTVQGGEQRIPIGRPISNTQIYIINKDQQLQGIGIPGELCIGGVGLARGYINNRELTAEKFIASPFRVGERLYKTGDIARWLPDGNIEYLGRTDDQVKIRGYRIELGEIERALEAYPGIDQGVVMACTSGEGEKELVAYFLSAEAIDLTDLRGQLGKTLPAYMVPGYFVPLETFPLTSSGKLNRKRLPDPEGLSLSGTKEYIAPRTDIEKKLAAIWQELLGRERVGVKDNFFELGGHSLRVMRLSAQVQKIFGVKIELREWFMTAVLEEQAVLIGRTAQTTFREIQPVVEQESYPLSSSQRRLWVLSQFEGGNIAYNIRGAHALEGSLDVAALRDSFEQLARRHEILRTVFRSDDRGEVRQYVLEAEDDSISLSSIDLREQPDTLQRLLEEEHLQPFDLSKGPLLRAVLYRTGDNRWVLGYVLHHIISDQWSMSIMIRELLQLYNARVHGEAYSLAPLRIQYKDYASWQQAQLKTGMLAGARNYWLGQLSGELPVLELPTDRARPAVKTYKGGLVQRQLNAELTAALKVTSQGQGGTLYMGLLSAVVALLYRYTGQEDIILGSPVAGREHSDLDGQLGFYINALALRTRFSGSDSYRTLLEAVKQVTVEAYEHQAYPFDALVGDLPLARDRSRSPLFDVLVDYHEEDGAGLQPGEGLSELSAGGYDRGEHGVSKYDLTFMFVAAGEATTVLLEYNSDLYDRATIERMGDHLEGLLTSIGQSPETQLAALEYIKPIERHTVVETFNATGSWGVYEPVISLFDAQAARVPENIAVVYGSRLVTYRTLQERSVALGNYLRQHSGVQPGELVGILLDRSENMVVAILGILRAGGAYVPIDPSYPAARKEYIIQDTGITTLLTQTEYLFDLDYYGGNVIALDVQLEGMDSVETLSDLQLEAMTADDKLRAILPAEQDAAYVIYTSGSTGLPKGCVVTQGNLSGYVRWANEYYFGGDVPHFGLYTSLSFDLTVTSIFCALTLGGRLTVYGQQEEISAILSDMFGAGSGIDHIKLTPSHINLLKGLGLRSTLMKRAIVGGEQVTAEQVRILKELNPAITIYNEYGPTETTVGCVVGTLEPDQPVLIGRPISGVRIYILDKTGKLCPIGVPGEIGIAGGGVSRGYWNKEALTAEKICS